MFLFSSIGVSSLFKSMVGDAQLEQHNVHAIAIYGPSCEWLLIMECNGKIVQSVGRSS